MTVMILFHFALGFLMRIAGSWLFGNITDRKGRKYAISFSVLLMLDGSLMIALIPTYTIIGVADYGSSVWRYC